MCFLSPFTWQWPPQVTPAAPAQTALPPLGGAGVAFAPSRSPEPRKSAHCTSGWGATWSPNGGAKKSRAPLLLRSVTTSMYAVRSVPSCRRRTGQCKFPVPTTHGPAAGSQAAGMQAPCQAAQGAVETSPRAANTARRTPPAARSPADPPECAAPPPAV